MIEGNKEAVVQKWYVKEGDLVDDFQVVADVSTDKLTTQITSYASGKVHRLAVDEGEACAVGGVLLEVEVDDATPQHVNRTLRDAPREKTVEGSSRSVVDACGLKIVAQPSSGVLSDDNSNSEQVLASPAVRRLARSLGIDLKEVEGTGEEGRILKEDIESYEEEDQEQEEVHAPVQPQAPVAPSGPGVMEIYAFNQIETGMVKSMHYTTTVPHFNFCDEFDVTRLVNQEEKIK